MPTYDYECKKCGHTWEAFQSIKAEPLKKCPECKKAGAQRMKRVVRLMVTPYPPGRLDTGTSRRWASRSRSWRRAARAAFDPQAPWTPPPGWDDADAR